MPRVTCEEVDGLITTDLTARLKLASAGSEGTENCLTELVNSACGIAEEAAGLPTGSQFSVALSLPTVSADLSETSKQVFSTLSNVLQFITGEEVYASDVKDWTFVEDVLDNLYGRIDDAIASDGVAPSGKPISASADSQLPSTDMEDDRPQSAWKDLTDNYRTSFVPRISEKLNAVEPLDPVLLAAQSNLTSLTHRSTPVEFGNIYAPEIKECMKSVYAKIDATETLHDIAEPFDLSSTELVFVDSDSSLDTMIEEIMMTGEVAIDLEHHDVHSYRGFTSLIQLSTRHKDYIVDPFSIFHSLHKLNKFTTDPAVKKTLHGADMDIQWLQRDFGVYVVNMFDTGQAARVLGIAGGFGLANLLDTFCRVKTNKKFQMSDWRIRPLTADMLQYARLDTHYLLYIRERLENLLLGLGSGGSAMTATVYGKKMMKQVIEKSFGVSLKVYKDNGKDYELDGVHQLCLKSSAMKVGSIRNNPRAMTVLASVLKWRDTTGRKMDESRHFVLTNASCLRIANVGPTTVPQILRIVSSEFSNMFPSMRISSAQAEEILNHIKADLALLDAVPVPTATAQAFPSLSAASAGKKDSKISSVVFAKKFGHFKKPSIPKSPVAAPKLFDVTIPESTMVDLLSCPDSASLKGKSAECLEEIGKIWSECPPSQQPSLQSYLTQPQGEAMMEIEAANTSSIALGTDFVEFTNRPSTSAKKGDLTMMEGDEIPLTVREQRKRAPVEPTTAGKKKTKKGSAAATAAVKALEFIENELSLSKR